MEFVLDKLKESNTQYAEIFRRTEQSKLSQIAPHELRNIFNPAVDKMMGEMDGWARRVWNGLSEPRVDPLRRLQCSHCKNPSVGLRKCAKCSQARYVLVLYASGIVGGLSMKGRNLLGVW